MQCVLLIEPNPVIGLDVTDALVTAGLRTLAPVPDAASALLLLPHLQPDCVVFGQEQLDEVSGILLQALRRRGVPVVLHASPGIRSAYAVGSEDVLVLSRPAWSGDVVEAVAFVCRQHTHDDQFTPYRWPVTIDE